MKDYFKDAIVYYFKWLIEQGYGDPVKIIISDFLDTVKTTEEQKKYITRKATITKSNIDNLIILVKKMKMDKKVDIQSLDLIEEYLRKLN